VGAVTLTVPPAFLASDLLFQAAGSLSAAPFVAGVLVMPSYSQYWRETFGVVSIEAQHWGCRVVASGDGNLPESLPGASARPPTGRAGRSGRPPSA
jgi:hypothetical protein